MLIPYDTVSWFWLSSTTVEIGIDLLSAIVQQVKELGWEKTKIILKGDNNDEIRMA